MLLQQVQAIQASAGSVVFTIYTTLYPHAHTVVDTPRISWHVKHISTIASSPDAYFHRGGRGQTTAPLSRSPILLDLMSGVASCNLIPPRVV